MKVQTHLLMQLLVIYHVREGNIAGAGGVFYL